MSNENSDLKENPYAQFEDKADFSVPSATLDIYKTIGDDLINERLGPDSVNRCSAATMCVKRRWFQAQNRKGTPLTPRKEVNFLLGDLSERVLLYYIAKSLVGPGKLYSEIDLGNEMGEIHFQGKPIKIYSQKTMSFTHKGLTITGHADGFGKRNSDGKWELIEIKSAADWGFKTFQAEGPGDYLKQSHALMMTNECREKDIREVRFFYLRKMTGHIWDSLHKYDRETARQVFAEYLVAASDNEPKAPHQIIDETYRKKPTGRKTAGFPCTYCPYLKDCHGEFVLDWKADQWGNKTPMYIFNETGEKTNEV